MRGHPRVVSHLCFSPTVNPCCYYPCQHKGICVRFGLDRYQCDCTRTGYSGPNCTIREPGLLTPLLSWAPLLPWACPENPPVPALVSGLSSVLLPCLALTSDTLPDPAEAELSLLAHLLPSPCPLPSHLLLALSCVDSPKVPSLLCPVCSARFCPGLIPGSHLSLGSLLALPGGPD